MNEAILCHIQMGIDLHGGSDTGVADGFWEGGQIKVGIILVFDEVVRHISMSQTVHRDRVGQADLFADPSRPACSER